MKTGKVLLGILGGLAAGALLGILLAPDKGENTRKKIIRKGEDLADDLKDRVDEMMEGVNVKLQNLVKDATNMVKRGKENITTIKAEVVEN